MVKKACLIVVFSLTVLLNVSVIQAIGGYEVAPGDTCPANGNATCCKEDPVQHQPCVPDPNLKCLPSLDKHHKYPDGSPALECRAATAGEAIGTITPPEPLKGFLQKNPTGAGAISQFLSNAVTLIFSLAGIVLLFMIIWGAFDWMSSGGEKEKIASARGKIFNAIIGIILFALAFAILGMLGRFTGFTFFAVQNYTVHQDANGRIDRVDCSNGRQLAGNLANRDLNAECQK